MAGRLGFNVECAVIKLDAGRARAVPALPAEPVRRLKIGDETLRETAAPLRLSRQRVERTGSERIRG